MLRLLLATLLLPLPAHADTSLPSKIVGPDALKITPSGPAHSLKAPGSVHFSVRPAKDGHFDLSRHSYLSLHVTNTGRAILWLEGRLDNPGGNDWSNSAGSQLTLLPGESGVLGFPFQRGGQLDDAPEIFNNMTAKPNGWRSHWKGFNPAKITQLRIKAHSPKPLSCTLLRLTASQTYGRAANTTALELPFLDQFGQVRQRDWPGKTRSTSQLHATRDAESETLTPIPTFNRFGGWADGPGLKATGHFRLEKVDGKWWFVDPDGKLFWSHGVCAVGFHQTTPLTENRRALFSWIPDQEDPLFASTIVPKKNNRALNYLGANLHRKFGPEWQAPARDLTHRRLRSYGLNTLGAWSDTGLQRDQRTPYTPIFHVNWPSMDKIPQPYGGGFAKSLRNALTAFVQERGQDPWVLGVFINNEIHWPRDLGEKMLQKPHTHPAKIATVAVLMEKFKTIGALNKQWDTKFKDWNAFAVHQDHPWTDARRNDFERIQSAYAAEYYRVCRDAVRELLPGKLYLGSRIHSCPDFVSNAAAKYVDVFSVNHYWNLAGLGKAPGNSDVPVMVTEFHFGAGDRGPLGVSLCPVHDQTQRARAYTHYVLSALQHPRIVGTHHFQWHDQSSAGRPGENYQVGFIDITDTPYPEFTQAVRTLGQQLYPLRQTTTGRLPTLEALLSQ